MTTPNRINRDPVFTVLDRLIEAGLGDIPREPLSPLTDHERKVLNSVRALRGWQTRRKRKRTRRERIAELADKMRTKEGAKWLRARWKGWKTRRGKMKEKATK